MVKERACRTCRKIVSGQLCSRCKTYTLSHDFAGLVIILDAKDSQIAKKLNIMEKGKYALKVR
ncbi:MAG: transcription elongation factor subunit Spt4 [Promethearchaeota archaeon]